MRSALGETTRSPRRNSRPCTSRLRPQQRGSLTFWFEIARSRQHRIANLRTATDTTPLPRFQGEHCGCGRLRIEDVERRPRSPGYRRRTRPRRWQPEAPRTGASRTRPFSAPRPKADVLHVSLCRLLRVVFATIRDARPGRRRRFNSRRRDCDRACRACNRVTSRSPPVARSTL